jgi:hypothetical protein
MSLTLGRDHRDRRKAGGVETQGFKRSLKGGLKFQAKCALPPSAQPTARAFSNKRALPRSTSSRIGLLGSVFTGLGSKIVAREGASSSRCLERFSVERNVDQRVSLRIISRGAHGQAKLALGILLDQERAHFGVGGHVGSLRKSGKITLREIAVFRTNSRSEKHRCDRAEAPPHRCIYSGSCQVYSRNLAALILFQIIRYALILIQGAHAGTLDSRDVHKSVVPAALRRDEAEALVRVEKFNGSDSHNGYPLPKRNGMRQQRHIPALRGW